MKRTADRPTTLSHTCGPVPAVPNLDYSQFPVSYQINGQTVIPLMLARIPAGGSGSIPIQVTVPSTVTDFSIQAYNWAPFASSLADLQSGFATTTTPASRHRFIITPCGR